MPGMACARMSGPFHHSNRPTNNTVGATGSMLWVGQNRSVSTGLGIAVLRCAGIGRTGRDLVNRATEGEVT